MIPRALTIDYLHWYPQSLSLRQTMLLKQCWQHWAPSKAPFWMIIILPWGEA